MTIVFYISGHGFGHASRDIEVINALGRIAPSTRVIVRTAAPRWLFDLTLTAPHTYHQVDTDTGIVQHDSVTHDIPETMRRLSAFYQEFDGRIEAEAAFLDQVGAALVLGDIPPLAFAAAARAGIASCALGNFTWDWIYEGYPDAERLAPGAIERMRSAYSHACEAWRLPMHGGFARFETIVDVPFIARHATHPPEETRRTLGLPLDRPVVLSSFGGYGLASLPLDRLDCLDEYDVVITEASLGGSARRRRRGVYTLEETEIYTNGLRYEDLVRAADVVLTKPGYGIISECVANDTALVYTSRGAFREYDVLVREMPKFLRCAFISHEDLFAGRWRASLDAARSASPPPTRPAVNGAEVVAGLISDRLTGTDARELTRSRPKAG